MTIFKITRKHLNEHPELEEYDLGMYGLKLSDDREIMIYENKAVAKKALEYFKKSFKRDL
tara:strand:+ start:262 stop:441 length:180 start_codon:yes stop_codon:yes gene_type:complete